MTESCQARCRPWSDGSAHGAGWLCLVGLSTFQALTLCLPNAIVQRALWHPGFLPLLGAQAFNLAFCLIFVLAGFRRPGARFLLLAAFLISLYLCHFLWAFGSMPSAGTYESILHAGFREAREYAFQQSPLLLLLVVAGAAYLQAHRWIARPWGQAQVPARSRVLLALSVLVFSGTSGWLAVEDFTSAPQAPPSGLATCVQHSFPVGFLLSAWKTTHFVLDHRASTGPRDPQATRAIRTSDREVVVLVIGESASANDWSLNGFPYPSNPRVTAYQAAGGLIYFPHVYSQANLTHFAVPMIVTAAIPATFSPGRKEATLMTAFDEVGFSTHWISNQERLQYPGDADEAMFVSDYGFRGRQPGASFDAAVLPFVDQALASPTRKLFIAVHLMGSHATYSRRVPPDFATPGLAPTGFQQDYVRTICYTDAILGALMDRLAGLKARCLLWYVSDHGEIPQAWDVGHGRAEPVLGELQIPMLVWGNPAFWSASGPAQQRLRQHRGEPMSQGVTFPTLLSLAGIRSPLVDPRRDLTSRAYEPLARLQVIAPDGRIRDLQTPRP